MKIALVSDLHYGMDGKTHNKLLKFAKRLQEAILKEDVKVLIVAGDSASTRQRHVKRLFELLREHISIPILAVRGNHDFWCGSDRQDSNIYVSLQDVYNFHRQVFSDNDIHHLDEPFEIEDVLICGFDGWYSSTNPPSNDAYWMPKQSGQGSDTMTYLTHKAWKDLQKCLDLDTSKYRKKVIVTHHNVHVCYYHGAPGMPEMSGPYCFYDEIKEKFDVLCYGHTHQRDEADDNGFRRYNAGADYNKPNYIIFEV